MIILYGIIVELLHVKDGFIIPPKPNMAVGNGMMNYPSIIEALPSSVLWLIVELEDCATNMLEAVQESLQYMNSINFESLH